MADEYVLDDNGEPKLDADGNKILVTPKEPPKLKVPEGVDQELIQKLIQDGIKEGIDAALKDVKENLDTAYAARDAEKAKVAEYEQKERDAEIQRLKDEGKHKEAHEKELAEVMAREAALKKTNIELTRDIQVRNALSATDFRSEKAAEMAFKEISGELIQNENGNWVTKAGVPVKEHVTTYLGEEDNSFLLKQKANSGSGSHSSTTNTPPGDKGNKSIFARSQEEVLQMAEKGELPNQQT